MTLVVASGAAVIGGMEYDVIKYLVPKVAPARPDEEVSYLRQALFGRLLPQNEGDIRQHIAVPHDVVFTDNGTPSKRPSVFDAANAFLNMVGEDNRISWRDTLSKRGQHGEVATWERMKTQPGNWLVVGSVASTAVARALFSDDPCSWNTNLILPWRMSDEPRHTPELEVFRYVDGIPRPEGYRVLVRNDGATANPSVTDSLCELGTRPFLREDLLLLSVARNTACQQLTLTEANRSRLWIGHVSGLYGPATSSFRELLSSKDILQSIYDGLKTQDIDSSCPGFQAILTTMVVDQIFAEFGQTSRRSIPIKTRLACRDDFKRWQIEDVDVGVFKIENKP